MDTPVVIIDVLKDAIAAMQVAKPEITPVVYFTINFEPGLSVQILDSLKDKDGTSYSSLKYPLIAVLMPFSEKNNSGFLDVTFPRIIIANLTKTQTRTEKVIDKYSSDGVFKTILIPCLTEFKKRLAWSTSVNLGDPDMIDCTVRHYPAVQKIGDGLTDFVDMIEILNLNLQFYSSIKTC